MKKVTIPVQTPVSK